MAGSSIDPERIAGTLSMPEQQIVEIAKAIGAKAKIVIMDEPTASLTEREVRSLFRVIAKLRGQGSGIVYISHRLEEVKRICDRATVLRHGKVVGHCNPRAETASSLARMMVGNEVQAVVRAPVEGIDKFTVLRTLLDETARLAQRVSARLGVALMMRRPCRERHVRSRPIRLRPCGFRRVGGHRAGCAAG